METNFNAFFIDLDGTTIDIPEEQNTENLGISEQNLYALQQISKKKPRTRKISVCWLAIQKSTP